MAKFAASMSVDTRCCAGASGREYLLQREPAPQHHAMVGPAHPVLRPAMLDRRGVNSIHLRTFRIKVGHLPKPLRKWNAESFLPARQDVVRQQRGQRFLKKVFP